MRANQTFSLSEKIREEIAKIAADRRMKKSAVVELAIEKLAKEIKK